MLDSQVRSEAQKSSTEFFFKQDGTPPHITGTIRSSLNGLFARSWIGKYGLTG